ncbi:hypothetical protein AAY473_006601 [Plecturocebus cupreus]
MQLNFPHLGKWQGSAHPECNGQVSPWENHLHDRGISTARADAPESYKMTESRSIARLECRRDGSLQLPFSGQLLPSPPMLGLQHPTRR